MKTDSKVSALSAQELLDRLHALAKEERKGLVRFLIYLAEVDQRRLYAEQGYSSMYAYLTDELHYSEGSAMRRIQAERLSARFPFVLERIEYGKLNLGSLSLVAKILTEENHQELLLRIESLSQREVERLVAEHAGRSILGERDRIRFLRPQESVTPTQSTESRTATSSTAIDGCTLFVSVSPTESKAPKPAPLRKVKIEFVADERILELIEEAKSAISHSHPNASLEVLFQRALETLLEKNSKLRRAERVQRKKAKATSESPIANETLPPVFAAEPLHENRVFPRPVQHVVWIRDGGQCTYVSSDGKRCTSKTFLEIDHARPWARGGSSSDPTNLGLLCKCHNLLAARQVFGEGKISSHLQ